MPIAYVPNFAYPKLAELANQNAVISKFSDNQMGSSSNPFYKYIITGITSGGVIHIHKTRNDIRSIRWKSSDSSSSGTNLILRANSIDFSIGLSQLDNDYAFSYSLAQTPFNDARTLITRLRNAVLYVAPVRTSVVGSSGIKRKKN